MKDQSEVTVGGVMVGLTLGAALAFMLSLAYFGRVIETLRIEAVQRGYAEWITADDGTTDWQWARENDDERKGP